MERKVSTARREVAQVEATPPLFAEVSDARISCGHLAEANHWGKPLQGRLEVRPG